jgi:hypothetical protein
MKRNILLIVYIILLCFALLFVSFSNVMATTEKNYRLSLTSKTCQVLRIDTQKPVQVYLDVRIILYNSGPDASDDITVTIMDSADLTPIRRNAIILANKSHMFNFTGDTFPVIGEGQHTINISYSPTDKINVTQTSLNSGIDTLTVQAGSSGTGKSTPGFELLILMSALIITIVVLKKKKTR